MPEFSPSTHRLVDCSPTADTADSAVAAASSTGDPTLVEEFYTPSPAPMTDARGYASIGYAQTIPATSTFSLTRVQLPLLGGGDVTFAIATTLPSSGAPDPGNVLATLNVSIPSTGDWTLFDFDFPAGVELTSGVGYAFMLHGPIWWRGQYPRAAPARGLFYNWDGWLPMPQPAGLYVRLFTGPLGVAAAPQAAKTGGTPDSNEDGVAFRMGSTAFALSETGDLVETAG